MIPLSNAHLEKHRLLGEGGHARRVSPHPPPPLPQPVLYATVCMVLLPQGCTQKAGGCPHAALVFVAVWVTDGHPEDANVSLSSFRRAATTNSCPYILDHLGRSLFSEFYVISHGVTLCSPPPPPPAPLGPPLSLTLGTGWATRTLPAR